MKEENTLAEAAQKLEEASSRYKVALEQKQIASRDECTALNSLNEAQRIFDDAVEAIKKQSPGGDWKDNKKGRFTA